MSKRIVFFTLVAFLLLSSISTFAQDTKNAYWQIKADFLEPAINQTVIVRLDYGIGRHLFGLVGGGGGRINCTDNKQFDTYQDKINYRLGLEYQYFLSMNKQNRGFYVGGDFELGSRTVESKISNESVQNISVFTPGVWFGYLCRPLKNANLYVDLSIVNPRYTFGKIETVSFQSVSKPCKPENLFNFLGPCSIG